MNYRRIGSTDWFVEAIQRNDASNCSAAGCGIAKVRKEVLGCGKLFECQFEINLREVDFHIHSVVPTDLSFANAETSSTSKWVGKQKWKMQQNESVEVALDVNNCHHRMEAGGLRECVADLLPYIVNCSERE